MREIAKGGFVLKKSELAPNHLFAEGVLVFVVLLWSTTFILVQRAITPAYWSGSVFTPNSLITYRFTISAIALFLWKPGIIKQIKKVELRAGILLGAILYIAFLTQTIGLQYTTTSKSGFITALCLIFVPFLSIAIEKKIPRMGSIVGTILALSGLYLLLNPFAENSVINRGDVMTLICAIMWGFYIVLLSYFTSKGIQIFPFVFVQFAAMAVFCWIYFAAEGEKVFLPEFRLAAIVLFLSLFCTFLTTILQNLYQKFTTSTRAALIFSAEPLIVAILGYFILSEQMAAPQVFGGMLIVAGVLSAELF